MTLGIVLLKVLRRGGALMSEVTLEGLTDVLGGERFLMDEVPLYSGNTQMIWRCSVRALIHTVPGIFASNTLYQSRARCLSPQFAATCVVLKNDRFGLRD